MNEAGALQLMDTVFPLYLDEFRNKFPTEPTDDPKQFHLVNGNFMAIDAHVYYAFIRHFQPVVLVLLRQQNAMKTGARA